MTDIEYFESLIGKIVEYDFGGSCPLRIKVDHVKTVPWSWIDDDGIGRTSIQYAISENGWSWYTANRNNIAVI